MLPGAPYWVQGLHKIRPEIPACASLPGAAAAAPPARLIAASFPKVTAIPPPGATAIAPFLNIPHHLP